MSIIKTSINPRSAEFQANAEAMGRIVADQADLGIVTDDNPRGEDAAEIRRMVLAGAPGATEIGDRRAAIAAAIAAARTSAWPVPGKTVSDAAML